MMNTSSTKVEMGVVLHWSDIMSVLTLRIPTLQTDDIGREGRVVTV